MITLDQDPISKITFTPDTDTALTRIDCFREIVESSLRADFSQNTSLTSEQKHLRSQLSTEPSQIGQSVTSAALRGECGSISTDLGRALKKNGIKTSFVNSARFQNVGDAIHYFLLIDGDIAVDPTIGQYIEGHNHVFVGSIDDLRKLVLLSAEEGNFTILAQRLSRYGAEEFFERVWGSKQKIVW